MGRLIVTLTVLVFAAACAGVRPGAEPKLEIEPLAEPAVVKSSARRPRARDLGVIIGRFAPGRNNAITDVGGVRVGQVTLNRGTGPLVPGEGPVRTGVTVIIPGSGDPWTRKPMAGTHVLNGNGEAPGLLGLP